MKTPKFLTLLVVLGLVFALAFTGPIFAQDDDDDEEERERSDNKILITGVPQGWSAVVVPQGAEWPRGPGNVPDTAGTITAYAPLNKTSFVYLWDGTRNNLIATVNPTATYPDTVLGAQVQFAQGFPAQGLAAPAQPGQSSFGQPMQGTQPSQFTRQYTVKPGDTLDSIAQQYGTTIVDLARANPNLITAGEVLMVP